MTMKKEEPFDGRVSLDQAQAPRPNPPDNVDPRAWFYYYTDLACWKATQADRLTYGIRDEEQS